MFFYDIIKFAYTCIECSPECGSLCSVGRYSCPPCVCPGLSWSPVGCTAHRDGGRVDSHLHDRPEQNRKIGKGREKNHLLTSTE